MPYELIWEQRGVHKRFWGDLSAREIVESVEKVCAHRRFDEIGYILNDFLDVTSHSIDADSLQRIMVSRIGATFTNPRIRVLMVTTDPELFSLAGLTKPRAPHPDKNETKGFATLIDARQWFARQPPIT